MSHDNILCSILWVHSFHLHPEIKILYRKKVKIATANLPLRYRISRRMRTVS